MGGTQADDDGLKNLKYLPQLQELNLWETSVTDEGLRHAAELAGPPGAGPGVHEGNGRGVKTDRRDRLGWNSSTCARRE